MPNDLAVVRDGVRVTIGRDEDDGTIRVLIEGKNPKGIQVFVNGAETYYGNGSDND